ncbi:Ig-like domain-containing protein, partial [Bacillus cereus]|uniref:Ig-like domain-containing protein n=1 Tax=Bacillus cereus TaxID=1396 RepID=UPI00211D30D8
VKTNNPDKPVVDYVAPGMTKVTGKAEVGSEISIKVFDPSSAPMTTTYKAEDSVSSDGSFSVDIAPPSKGALVWVTAEKNGLESVTQVKVGE